MNIATIYNPEITSFSKVPMGLFPRPSSRTSHNLLPNRLASLFPKKILSPPLFFYFPLILPFWIFLETIGAFSELPPIPIPSQTQKTPLPSVCQMLGSHSNFFEHLPSTRLLKRPQMNPERLKYPEKRQWHEILRSLTRLSSFSWLYDFASFNFCH